ncbi:MAG: ankyrin repeat domain-containing protein [Ottowia sp.]|nr:ankyrin repeat domain-containing protein [Ottowia sp.]
MDGIHEYLLRAQQELKTSNLENWWQCHCARLENGIPAARFLDFFARAALLSGDERLLDFMLAHGADANQTEYGEPLIFLALAPISRSGFSSLPMLKRLIAAGAELNCVNPVGGLTPLMAAINADALPHAVLLLDAGADPWHASPILGMNPIEYAAKLKKQVFLELMRECY